MQSLEDDVAAINRIPAVRTILDVVSLSTGMGFVAVARVTEDRWVACAVKDQIGFGLSPGGELKVETTICHEVRHCREAVVIDEVAADAIYRAHPTPALYQFQSYISMPVILPDGRFFGTLCAIDPRPARLKSPEVIGMFRLFAELIAFHLEAHDAVALTQARLFDEQKTSALREQFIAVLGHDLINPLSAIANGIEMLALARLDDDAKGILGVIHASAKRMSGLIDNVMDFTRGRMGGGLTLDRNVDEKLESVLRHVVAEQQARSPDRAIEADISLRHPVLCDRVRMAQLLSNLVANAVRYGAATGPVLVQAATDGTAFELSVTNSGDPIEPAALAKLFQPFTRGPAPARSASPGDQEGLGLGLFIASEVAKAHGGTLSVTSSAERTRFTFHMPLA